jgi:hypothetical protein
MRAGAVLALAAGLVAGAPSAGSAAEDDHLRVLSVGVSSGSEVTALVAAPYALSGRVLGQRDFRATLNGVARPVRVEHEEASTVDVVVVVDNRSDVPLSMLQQQQGSVAQMLVDLVGTERVAIYTTTSPSPLQGFTTDRQALLSSLRRLRVGRQDELAPALGSAFHAVRRGSVTRRVLIGFSAGGRDAAAPSPTALADTLAGMGVQFHWLVLSGEPPALAERLATLTSRPVVHPAGTPLAVLDRLVAELRSEYRVTIDTGRTGGSVRLALVAVTPEQEVTIDARARAPLPTTRPPNSQPAATPGAGPAAAPARAPNEAQPIPGSVRPRQPERTWWPSGDWIVGFVLIGAGSVLLVLGGSIGRSLRKRSVATASAVPSRRPDHDACRRPWPPPRPASTAVWPAPQSSPHAAWPAPEAGTPTHP